MLALLKILSLIYVLASDQELCFLFPVRSLAEPAPLRGSPALQGSHHLSLTQHQIPPLLQGGGVTGEEGHQRKVNA